jgi:hypothetical protein
MVSHAPVGKVTFYNAVRTGVKSESDGNRPARRVPGQATPFRRRRPRYPAAVILCASCLRPPTLLGPDRIVRLAAEAGFTGLAVDNTATLGLLPAVATEGMRSGLPVALLVTPLPAEPLPGGKRLPHLGAVDDPEERRAAAKLCVAGIERGGPLGVGLFLLDFGKAALHAREADLRARFARAEMDEGEPGRRLLDAALEERRGLSERLLDAGRSALERLLPAVEREGASLLLPIAATPWELPSGREALVLLREFAGAPLALALAPARRAVLRTLGLEGPPERWTELEQAARALVMSDAVGLEHDLVFGVGELGRAPASRLGNVPQIVAGRSDTTIRELSRARRWCAELTAGAAAEAERAEAAANSGEPARAR